jgi:predicted ester cyclase
LPAAGNYSKEQIAGLFHRMVGQLKAELKMTVKSMIAEGDQVASRSSPMANCKTAESITTSITSC